MAGYDGYSMSNNARAAYADGLVPASKTGIPIQLLEEFCDAAKLSRLMREAGEALNEYDAILFDEEEEAL